MVEYNHRLYINNLKQFQHEKDCWVWALGDIIILWVSFTWNPKKNRIANSNLMKCIWCQKIWRRNIKNHGKIVRIHFRIMFIPCSTQAYTNRKKCIPTNQAKETILSQIHYLGYFYNWGSVHVIKKIKWQIHKVLFGISRLNTWFSYIMQNTNCHINTIDLFHDPKIGGLADV